MEQISPLNTQQVVLVKYFILSYNVILQQWLSVCGPRISRGSPELFR
jgi:hypothetical protein